MAVYKNDAGLMGLWLLEEANGTRLDYTPNNNDLADNNTVASSADCKEGVKSADFESDNNEWLSIADAAQTGLAITGAISLGAWIKPESLSDANGHAIIMKYLTTGNQRSYALWLQPTTGSYYVRCNLSNNGTDVTAATGATALSAGTWYHICAVYDHVTDIRVYVDGLLDSNGAENPKAYSGGIADKSSEFRLGRHPVDDWEYDGLMDEVFVFNRALSAAEVLEIKTNGIQTPAGGGGVPKHMMYYKRLREAV